MLQELKDLIDKKASEYFKLDTSSRTDSLTDSSSHEHSSLSNAPQTPEQKIIHSFEDFSASLISNDNFPRKSHETLNSIVKVLKEIDFQTINLPDQALIRKIIEKDVPAIVELYMSLPKAHAVSFILENGKTSKDTFILKLNDYQKKISEIWSVAVEEKTKLLLQRQKKSIGPLAVKKDFFDL